MGDEQIAVDLSTHTYREISSIQKEEQTDQSAIVEELLVRGIEDWKREEAAQQYRNGTISIETAAKRAGLTHWEFLNALEMHDVTADNSEPERANALPFAVAENS